ncbi:hypothetical protein HOY80DRAFT_770386 [Tuber brumale]|nr:hypothetical protein HOY80DRAFT_770386 [Tuber brumale]
MSESSNTSISLATFPSDGPSLQRHPWRNLVRNKDHTSPATNALHPETFIPPSTPPDTLSTSRQLLPTVIYPRAGTLGYLVLERSLAVAMNTPLESNLTKREIIESFQSGGVQFSVENESETRLKGGDYVMVGKTPERSDSENEVIFHPSQTGGAVACGLDTSGSTGSQEEPRVHASKGDETSSGKLDRVLERFHDERVRRRAEGKGIWGYFGY